MVERLSWAVRRPGVLQRCHQASLACQVTTAEVAMEAEVAPGPDPQSARRAANRRKLREHRQRLRAQGMRPIQIRVPGVHAPRRQSVLANASPDEPEIQAFIDSVTEWPDSVGFLTKVDSALPAIKELVISPAPCLAATKLSDYPGGLSKRSTGTSSSTLDRGKQVDS